MSALFPQDYDNAERMAETLKSDGVLHVTSGPEEFEIRKKGTSFPVGYAVFSAGRRRTPYRILNQTTLLAWLSMLRLLEGTP